MRKFALSLALVFVLAGSPPLLATDEAQPFATAKEIDLTQILPPPPANDSAETKKELAEVLTLQVTRTPEMEARAKAM